MPEKYTPPDVPESGFQSIAEILRQFDTTREGLTEDEAVRRLESCGPNQIDEERMSPLRVFASFFWGPIPWMIEAAAVLSMVARHWAEFGIICVLLLVNAVIGFWQEHKADSSISLLKQKLALHARVRRAGTWRTLPAIDLVPGDVIRVRLGDVVPADVHLIQDEVLDVDQSALTGESLPVSRTETDRLYSGSIVRRGEADAVVTATGMNTYFGRTANLMEQAVPESHYQKAVLTIGHFLILVTIALAGVILTVSLFRHTPFMETLQFVLVLAVAAIPVALPAVLSVTMAVGAVRLSRRKAIVSRLVAIEEMAGMDILCSDKTGTLTQNRLVLSDPVLYKARSEGELLRDAALASRLEDDDPMEAAIFKRMAKSDRDVLTEWTVERFVPFNPVDKRTEAGVVRGNERSTVSKGAPQVILELASASRTERQDVLQAVEANAARGFRVLLVAKTDVQGAWQLMGLLPFTDPPREDSAATLKAARASGVAVKMVTGDHLAIATEIARQLDLGGHILPSARLKKIEQSVRDEVIARADGFAEVLPEHKYRIVETLQRLGHFVGMTGDGVNDAPALKRADVGIAVAGATDAARNAADLVLTAPGLSVIVDAIEESRRIFQRMNSYAIFRIAETVRVLLFMTASILIFDFYPVTAVMIILLALLNDGPIMMIAYDRTIPPAEPARWEMHRVLKIAAVLGVLGVFASFLLFWIAEQVLRLDRTTIQTLIFLKLTVAGHMTIYLSRTGEKHFWTRPLPAKKLFFSAEVNQVLATLMAAFGIFMTPIGWKLALLVWGYAFGWFLINDQVKVITYRLLTPRSPWNRRHHRRIGASLHAHASGSPASARRH